MLVLPIFFVFDHEFSRILQFGSTHMVRVSMLPSFRFLLPAHQMTNLTMENKSTVGEACRDISNDMSRDSILAHMRKHNVRFLRLQFTDISGTNKNVEVPASQFEKALDGEIMFDGSSVEGFTRIEESDMLLRPDFKTYRIDPWPSEGLSYSRHGLIAHIICDVYRLPEGTPFGGCPRGILGRQDAFLARRRPGLQIHSDYRSGNRGRLEAHRSRKRRWIRMLHSLLVRRRAA